MQGSIHKKGTPVVVGVDDDFRLRESLQRLLESAGYTAFLYSSAEEYRKAVYPADSSRRWSDSRRRKSSSTPTTTGVPFLWIEPCISDSILRHIFLAGYSIFL